MPLSLFHPGVATWFAAALGAPTRVQAESWPPIARGETTLLLAPTGSGKTLAAFLAAIDRLARAPEPDPKSTLRDPRRGKKLRVLYVSPLKALAVDVERNLRAPLVGAYETAARLGQPLRRLEVAVRTGDTPAAERTRMLRTPPDILITTPESLFLMLTSSQRELLTSVETVIIDEIHQMAQSKRGAHLFLSLERLATIVEGDLQRIGLSATQKPLDEIARLLGGFTSKNKPRPVTIVDASAKKTLSITVEVPPPLPAVEISEDDEHDDKKSIWPQVHARLVERIDAARSTMVFVNSRRLAERLATALNETAGREIALAHHGSVAKESRRAIEERLKAGNLPCIVATSSLELGIDMGAVDQVIQVEAPPSVASGIQRIGRASHHVGGVPSGVLVPKHKHDLLACAAASAGIEAGDVEATFYPRNPLDVLAQQIVAIAAVGLGPLEVAKTRRGRKKKVAQDDEAVETEVEAIWDLVRRSAPFAELPRASFDGVLDMLSGRYPSDEFADLRPRLTWDRARGVVRPRVGAQRLAIMNAGTIPDRGLYGVFLQGEADGEVARGSSKQKPSRRVGELDEEMVFELREGEVFLLGASSWRTEQITRDRVLVSPAAGVPGKMPFWHGDRAGRTLSFGERIGRLVRKVGAASPAEAKVMLVKEHHLDDRAADDLVAYVHEERASAGTLPTDKTIVVERVPDELGDLRICLMTPFGSRVHAPWAMAALRRLKDARAGEIDAVWSDDGIVFRVPGGEAPPDPELLFPSSEEIEDVVTRELGGSSLFAARFREAAARALLLPRQAFGKRTPLWAQRKRATDLLSIAGQYPAFPIVLETYRECLRDAFDLPALVEVLRGVESRKIRVNTVDLSTPSPFCASLLFSFVGNFIYDEDAPAQERRAQALTIDHAQLRELLGETEIRKLLDPDIVLEHELMLQRKDRPLRHADALHDLLLWLGDLDRDGIASRATGEDVDAWIARLSRERRIVRVKIGGEERFVAVEDAARYRDALGVMLERGLPDALLGPTEGALVSLVARHARTHGPFTAADVAARFGIGVASAADVLERLVAAGKLASGAFLPHAKGGTEYVDVGVLRSLKQKTLAHLRKAIEPVSAAAYARFLIDWHHVDDARVVDERARSASSSERQVLERLLRVVTQLEGCPLPASVLEREILPARVPGYQRHHLDQLLVSGEVVWAGVEPIGEHDGRIAIYLADREALLAKKGGPDSRPTGELHEKLRALFDRRGAVFFPEIARTIGGYPTDTLDALWDLVWSGEVTNDSLEPLRSVFSRDRDDRPNGRRGRVAPRPARLGPRGSEGRWSLRSARWLEVPTDTQKATALAGALLERYGVVLREAAAAEGLAGGFANVYDVLRAMEDQGRVRRGYFVAERGATQFALPGAEERLRQTRPDDAAPRTLLLAATDPANPYGALVPWPARIEGAPTAQRTSGASVLLQDGVLLAWIARGGQSIISFLPREEPELTLARTALARGLAEIAAKRRRPTILGVIDGRPAPESPLAEALAGEGFAVRQGALSFMQKPRLASEPRPSRSAGIVQSAVDEMDLGDLFGEEDDDDAEEDDVSAHA